MMDITESIALILLGAAQRGYGTSFPRISKMDTQPLVR